MKGRSVLKPQDILVLFSLRLTGKEDWVIAEIANNACLSGSETHAAINRLEICGLFDPVTRRPITAAAKEFLLHGLKYAFPITPGGRAARGMPTGHSAPPLADRIIAEKADVYVWPCAFGNARGTSVTPLYSSVPDAAQKDERMYELLALTDALCIGRTRERQLAGEMLLERMAGDRIR